MREKRLPQAKKVVNTRFLETCFGQNTSKEYLF